jgi:hypothetical protein
LIVLVITYLILYGALSMISFPSSKDLITTYKLLPVPDIFGFLKFSRKLKASLTGIKLSKTHSSKKFLFL